MVAGVTERVQLGTSILVLPHRNPVMAAKMCATLDHLSGGRLVLGVGVGWMREEIELLGGNYDRRGAWSDEALAVMRACWRDARTAHRGQFFSFDEIGVFPKPTRGDIPILIGGHTERALRRVVQHGDGWHAAFITPQALEADLARLREECARQRRPPDQVTVSVRAGLSLRPSPLGPDRKPLQGSRDQVIADLLAYRDLGVESILLETRYRDLQDMLQHLRDLRPRHPPPPLARARRTRSRIRPEPDSAVGSDLPWWRGEGGRGVAGTRSSGASRPRNNPDWELLAADPRARGRGPSHPPAPLPTPHYFASWKITPSVYRRPAVTRLTPWRSVTRCTPRAPRAGRSRVAKITTCPCVSGTTSPRDCARGRCSTSRNSPPSKSSPGRLSRQVIWSGNAISP